MKESYANRDNLVAYICLGGMNLLVALGSPSVYEDSENSNVPTHWVACDYPPFCVNLAQQEALAVKVIPR